MRDLKFPLRDLNFPRTAIRWGLIKRSAGREVRRHDVRYVVWGTSRSSGAPGERVGTMYGSLGDVVRHDHDCHEQDSSHSTNPKVNYNN